MGIVSLKNNIGVPKYKQIVTSIEDAIANGNLKKGDQLPSLNAIKNKHKLSRDTVLTAFNELKNRGIIHSVVGKGYYVSSENIFVKQKIFVLFDELNSFKEDLYNSFLEHLGDDIQIDIFFHHFNKDIFKKLINDSAGNYSYYVIMPANLKDTKTSIQNLPSEKVYLLDQVPKELESYPSVYQDFENDIQKGLFTGLHAIRKYKKLVLVFSHKQPKQLLNGFKNFCENYKKTNGTDYNIYTDGLKIYTTIDSRMQTYAEQAVQQHMPRLQAEFFHQNTPKRNPTAPFLDLTLGAIDTLMWRSMRQSERWRHMKYDLKKSNKEIEESFEKPVQMSVFAWKDGQPTEIDTIMKHFMGIEPFIKMPTLPYDGIHHIDMHMKLLDEETILVGEYPQGVADGPQIEANINYIKNNYTSAFGTPYRFIRIQMPPDAQGQYPDTWGDYRTYTNSIFINKNK